MHEDSQSNLTEWRVSEISSDIKRLLEQRFDYVRVRGELGRVTLHRNGHLYADLKDDKSSISLVMFRNMLKGVNFRPEQGLEVVAEGKISAFAGQSKYQIIAQKLMPAGEGALMALLEKRKTKLRAEGLFDESRKRQLPFLPKTIGVITSPTGAVLRDILHRLRDRMPARVIVWPSLVQGEAAPPQIIRGINGLNKLPLVDRPDIIIVARGGGSFEDLWPFNDEDIVRAAAQSAIPIISAIGHETDTTLLDLVADRRAPTPTGAAEMVVPVRAELLLYLDQLRTRATNRVHTSLQQKQEQLAHHTLPPAEQVYLPMISRLELSAVRLRQAPAQRLNRARQALTERQIDKNHIGNLIRLKERHFLTTNARFKVKAENVLSAAQLTANKRFSRLRVSLLTQLTRRKAEILDSAKRDLFYGFEKHTQRYTHRLSRISALLEALSHKATLARGYAILRDDTGALISDKNTVKTGQQLNALVNSGEIRLAVIPEVDAPTPKKRSSRKPPNSSNNRQDNLL